MASWPYSTARWARLRAAVLRARPLCEHCQRMGQIVVATQVDHVRAIKDGGEPWARGNLQALCATCHSRKTNAEDGGCFHPARDRRVDPSTGRPLDPRHWWNIKQ